MVKREKLYENKNVAIMVMIRLCLLILTNFPLLHGFFTHYDTLLKYLNSVDTESILFVTGSDISMYSLMIFILVNLNNGIKTKIKLITK